MGSKRSRISDGGAAVELFCQHQPGVALIDLRMQRTSAVDALLAIRQRTADAVFELHRLHRDESIVDGSLERLRKRFPGAADTPRCGFTTRNRNIFLRGRRCHREWSRASHLLECLRKILRAHEVLCCVRLLPQRKDERAPGRRVIRLIPWQVPGKAEHA